MTGVGSDRVGSEAAGPLSGRASPTADPARSWSVYTHLLLFALAIAIPVVLTGIGLFVAGNQDERRELEKRLEVMALEFSRDIERDISSLATTLEVIALTPSLLSGDVETFQSFAVEVARRQNVNIILRAPTGEHIFNTRAPVDGGYSRSGMTLVDREGISKGKPYVTDVFVSAMRNQPIFIVSVPLKTGSYAGYTLNAAVEPTIFNLHVQFWNIPPGWTVRIYDRKRTPVFGSTFDGGVQTPMLDQSALKTLTAPGGTMEAKATSGESLLIGYQRIQISDWLVTVEMLSPSLVKLSTRRFQLLASLSIILLICSAALAAWFARRIAKPVGQLAQQANMLGSTETPNVQRLGIREIDDVLVRLSEASARLASSHAELRKSDDRLRLALEIGRMGTASWDIAGGSMELDAIGAAIYGLDQRTTQIALDSIVEFTIPEDRAAARSFFAKTSRSPDAITIRISRANDGAERFIAIRAQQSEPRPTKAGMSERVIGIIFDITEQKVAERGLEQLNLVLEQRVVERTHALELANSRLREEMAQREAAMAQLTQAQKLEALGQLTSSVAHDFNNQLLAILGGLELVSKQVDDPRLVRHIRNARSAARRASQLTDQLLSFSRRADLQPSNIHVADALAELDEVLRHAAGAKVTRSTDIAPETHAVWADPDQLHATLVNIAINARDAMPDGGELRITARNVDASQVPPDLGLPAEDFVVIAVSDTGIGMSEDVLRHATEPFFTTKPRGKGTGLGLAMARTFAEQSHGGLHISSSPGHGTTVEIYLPVAKALPKRAEAAAVVPPPPVTTNWLALCVDDDRQAVAVTAAFLGEMGMKVISDTDPASALDKIKSIDSLDLLVSDIDMPDIDGVEMAARVRQLFPGVEVLLVTGHQDHEVRLRGGIESVPGAALLRKPFSSADLAAKIASMTRSETSIVETVPANRRVAQR